MDMQKWCVVALKDSCVHAGTNDLGWRMGLFKSGSSLPPLPKHPFLDRHVLIPLHVFSHTAHSVFRCCLYIY